MSGALFYGDIIWRVTRASANSMEVLAGGRPDDEAQRDVGRIKVLAH